MLVQSISAINTKKAVDIFSHKLTKASLDAPIQEALAEVDSVAARANYFPFGTNTGKVVTRNLTGINDIDGTHEFISQTALACEFPKIK